MEKKFTALRLMATIWKIMAWIVLVLGILASIGMLVGSIVGGGGAGQILRQYADVERLVQGGTIIFGVVGGVIGFVISLIATIIYFLVLYALGEGISLFLAIEENTRLTAQWVAARSSAPTYPAAQPAYTPPVQQ